MKKLLLLLMLVVIGCGKASYDKSPDELKIGDKYLFTPSGCCGEVAQDTVEILEFKRECVLLKHSDGSQHLHHIGYFKSHIKSLE